MEAFAKKLRELREERRYSQSEMAKNIEVSQSYYSKFELDQGEPNLQLLVKISEFFDVSTDYLLGRSEIQNKFLEAKSSIDDFDMQLKLIGEQLEYFRGKDKEIHETQEKLAKKLAEVEEKMNNK